MEDQRDLISNHEQLPILGQRPRAQESKCGRGTLYTGFSVLVALLLAGQATTAYFLYQQQGRLDKLTVTSQNLQLESLRMKLPKPPKPVGQLRMATPLLMQALPMEGLPHGPKQNATKYGNMTQDHVMHLLLKSNPLKVYPQLKGSFPENLKHLKKTMNDLDWKVFENWMYQWLLFEMSKNTLEEKPTEVPTRGTGSGTFGCQGSGDPTGLSGTGKVRACGTCQFQHHGCMPLSCLSPSLLSLWAWLPWTLLSGLFLPTASALGVCRLLVMMSSPSQRMTWPKRAYSKTNIKHARQDPHQALSQDFFFCLKSL
uniref:CD74 molecule n=1 Tax=Sciurus vulgaris TaxID=55149 RepID=A0A8D2AZ92_SCIVU